MLTGRPMNGPTDGLTDRQSLIYTVAYQQPKKRLKQGFAETYGRASIAGIFASSCNGLLNGF